MPKAISMILRKKKVVAEARKGRLSLSLMIDVYIGIDVDLELLCQIISYKHLCIMDIMAEQYTIEV